MYCAITVHLSFTLSSLYMYAVSCNTFVHISFIFKFNVPSSVNNKCKFWRSKFWGPSDLTQIRTSEGQSPALLCEHIFLYVGRHIFFISNECTSGCIKGKERNFVTSWVTVSVIRRNRLDATRYLATCFCSCGLTCCTSSVQRRAMSWSQRWSSGKN
jgi:hypothetical protein